MLKLYNGYGNIESAAKGAVLAVGNFDGLHLGHQALIARAREIAAAQGAPLGVVTFEPHPREFFQKNALQKNAAPFRLTLLPAKARLLEALGVSHVFALPFDAALAGLDAEDFINVVLAQGLGAAHVVVGEGFAFGRGRGGTVAMLKEAGTFGVTALPPVLCAGGEIYSSTRIRAHIGRAEMEDAAALLGRAWEVEGEVIHGDKRGRTLGYPTANQDIGRYMRLPYGVYAVRAQVEGEDQWRDAVANFGIRPMFESEKPLLETFIFDYTHEIYGKILRIKPLKHLRPEIKFEGLPALLDQMKQDCLAAKAVLKSSTL